VSGPEFEFGADAEQREQRVLRQGEVSNLIDRLLTGIAPKPK
jgi:hypothetical protein